MIKNLNKEIKDKISNFGDNLFCEFCGQILDTVSITLPCGFLICAKHLNLDTEFVKCFICKDHEINIAKCLEMPRNRQIIKRAGFLILKDELNEIDMNRSNHIKIEPSSPICNFEGILF